MALWNSVPIRRSKEKHPEMNRAVMTPIDQFPTQQLKKIKYLLTDIDDTVTQDGLFPAASLSAMEQLSNAGIAVVPITGRPAGWCDHIARMWPVDAVVGENGAFYFSYNRKKHYMRQVFAKGEKQRLEDRKQLEKIRERILRKVPGAGIASDQDYRIADLAVDFCEDVSPLSEENVQEIVKLFEEEGATAKISSIHVNGWFGDYDKLSMTEICLKDICDIDIYTDNDSIIFIGDSPNDSPMFSFFKNSVGVANVADFDLPSPPAWITKNRSASGFREFVDALLAAKNDTK